MLILPPSKSLTPLALRKASKQNQEIIMGKGRRFDKRPAVRRNPSRRAAGQTEDMSCIAVSGSRTRRRHHGRRAGPRRSLHTRRPDRRFRPQLRWPAQRRPRHHRRRRDLRRHDLHADRQALVTAIGSLSPDSFFVWGINRGSGVPRLLFTGAPPSIRPDLDFDGVYLTQQDGSGVLGGLSFPPTFTLYPDVVTISGDTLTAVLPAALLPSTGFDPAHYQFTVWSHDPIDADTDPGNSRIADFSPTIQAQVPEPSSWALLIAGFGLAGSALRRRAAAAQLDASGCEPRPSNPGANHGHQSSRLRPSQPTERHGRICSRCRVDGRRRWLERPCRRRPDMVPVRR